MTMTTKPRRPSTSNHSHPHSDHLLDSATALLPQSHGPATNTKVPKFRDEGSSYGYEEARLGNGAQSSGKRVEITITPVPSVPESLEERGGLHMQKPTTSRTIAVKLAAISALLYLFVCSLGFLSDSFRLIAGKAAGEVLQQDKLINNPIVGVMMGILVTVAVQSSSTSTSIVVSMVASGLFTVKTAIPIIMGANIGTSVTNTVVALTHMSSRQDFERAFAGAVLHDMFNLLTVSSLLIVEQLTSYLEITTTKVIELMDLKSTKGGGEIQVLSRLTKPFTSLIIQINKDVIVGWSINDPKYDDARLLKVWCNSSTTGFDPQEHDNDIKSPSSTSNSNSNQSSSQISLNSANAHNFVDMIPTQLPTGQNVGQGSTNYSATSALIASAMAYTGSETGNTGQKCKFLFNMFNYSDLTVGIILLVISLILLCGCLVCIVKVLSSLLKGKLAMTVQKVVNANIPYVPCLTGYLAIAIGAVMTILVQSSSVFTSAMTPLIAMGMISLERAYPLTLGSNLGTTTTAMLAALATEGPNLRLSIQLALCHFLFNFTGILMFYPIPFTRFPIRMAASLGRITAQYRWFAIFYLIFMFAILPFIVFTVSLIGPIAFYSLAGPVGLILAFVLGLNLAQSYCPSALPEVLNDWNFVPIWCRSLEPYDRVVDRGITLWRLYCPCGGAVSGTRNVGGTLTGGMRQNNSQVCFINGSRSPSPQHEAYVFNNTGFNGVQSFLDLRNTAV